MLNTSLPVAMPWLDQVKGVLQMWWPGDEGGPATANVLLGRANPAGRLPITWPVRLDQMVAQDPAGHPERTNAGVDGKTTYSEGIFVGYRWFDQQNIAPLFPVRPRPVLHDVPVLGDQASPKRRTAASM